MKQITNRLIIRMKSKTRLLIIMALFGLWSTNGFSQASNEITIPLTDPVKRGKLRVNINSGSITVKGSTRKDVLVRHTTPEESKGKTKEGNGESREGLRRIDAGGLDIEITEHQNQLKITSSSWTKRVHIEVEVPNGFDVHLHTYNNGSITVSQIDGSLELENYNGKITALNISGSVVASTYNGDIKVSFDKATAGTPMSYSTYNGDIDITLPSSHKATIKARSERGSIYSDFDVQFRSSGPVQKQQRTGGVYKVVIDEWKIGDINGGGAEMTMQNYNGDLIIRKK